MNWLDIVLILVLAFSTLSGLRMGFIYTIFSIVGLYLGVVLAGNYYGALTGQLSSLVTDPNQAKVAAFAIIVIVILLLALLAALVVSRILSPMWGWADRLVGGILGFAAVAVACGALLLAAANFSFLGLDQAIPGSAIATLLLKYVPFVLNLLPGEFRLP